MKKLIIAMLVGILAFFELCFTGKATMAWKLARKGDPECQIEKEKCMPSLD
jgi:hypothetical protein